jgi:glycosyltransferase involved in cell wall biosynthesis
MVFDFSSVGTYHNGTFEVSKQILRHAARRWTSFNVHVLASDETVRFHELDRLDGIRIVPPSAGRTFAAALRMAQPFSGGDLARMHRLAPVNIYCMHDPIAYDCLYLAGQDGWLEHLWKHVFSHADGVLYVSDFVQELFRRRFSPRADLAELVVYNSLDFRDYRTHTPSPPPVTGHILVIGNAFHHKRLPETVELLSGAFPQENIVALGLKGSDRPNVKASESGSHSLSFVDDLIEGAKFVVFPSVYEGFGIPVVRSLACGRPVVTRRTPVTEAIRTRTGEFDNLVLYSSPADLMRRLKLGFPTWHDGGRAHDGDPSAGWAQAADRIGTLLVQAVGRASLSTVEARLDHLGEMAVEFEHLGKEVTAHQQRVRELETSLSWRVTAPLRVLTKSVMPFLRRRATGSSKN